MTNDRKRRFHVSYAFKQGNNSLGFGWMELSLTGGVLNSETIVKMGEAISEEKSIPEVVILAIHELENDGADDE